jgi:hypothetical protein
MHLPGRNAQSSLEDAAAHLRASMGAARRGRHSLLELRNLERAILLEWAARQGRIFEQDPTLSLERRQAHGEHVVGFDSGLSCWWKTTHPGKCGVGVEFHYDDLPPFRVMGIGSRELLPSEYVDRLMVHNREFGDDIRLEGYLDGEQPSLVISQPDIAGSPATAAQMTLQMERLGYRPMPELHVGKSHSISFYHPEKRIALFDAHPGNFFHIDGLTLPVDGIVLQIREEAEHTWLLDHAVFSD